MHRLAGCVKEGQGRAGLVEHTTEQGTGHRTICNKITVAESPLQELEQRLSGDENTGSATQRLLQNSMYLP